MDLLKKHNRKNIRGFSLVELLVVLSIFIVLTSAILVKYADFNGNLIVKNMAYEIAVSLREAQVYGLSSKESSSSVFNAGYGLNFDKTNLSSFTFFSDLPDPDTGIPDGIFNSNSDSVVNVFTLSGGNVIKEVCARYSSGDSCFFGNTIINKMNVTFKRPKPGAIFKSEPAVEAYNRVTITIKNIRSGRERSIIVESTGQISVE
jgi:prepilin-type N-terminal cleavage/methylation domain-containing protein